MNDLDNMGYDWLEVSFGILVVVVALVRLLN